MMKWNSDFGTLGGCKNKGENCCFKDCSRVAVYTSLGRSYCHSHVRLLSQQTGQRFSCIAAKIHEVIPNGD